MKNFKYRIREAKKGLFIPEIGESKTIFHRFANGGYHPLDGYRRTSFKVDFSGKSGEIGSVCWAANQLLDFALHNINISIGK